VTGYIGGICLFLKKKLKEGDRWWWWAPHKCPILKPL
jgi:hypothetical protein